MQWIRALPLLIAALLLAPQVQHAQQPGEILVERMTTGFQFTNGPAWTPEDYLLFSDTPTDRVFKLTPGKAGATEIGSRAGGVSATTYDTKGNLYTAQPRARRITRVDKKGKLDVLAERFEGKRLNAPNDIVARRDGNVYFTDPAFGEQQDTAELGFYGVFRVTPKGELSAIARWTTRPNGIALSENGRLLYVTDSDTQTVHALDLDKDGAASNDRVFASKIPGAPAGIRTDQAGNVYVAAREIFVYSPKAELIRTIRLGETPSNLTFGDADLESLYVTARTSVYRVRLGLKGSVSYLP
ncbi:MAG: SMP-30/gluconolactonase/LRE family protein [Acidobacteriota bacterium]